MEVISYLSLGANLGNRMDNIEKALQNIENDCGEILDISPIYETEPLGFDSEDQFLNICVKLKTKLTPKVLLSKTQEIERSIGREKKSNGNYSSRKIDIDIITYGDLITESIDLTIPHPRYKERRFVLQPLNDIAKEFLDPCSGETIEHLLNICPDDSEISIYKN